MLLNNRLIAFQINAAARRIYKKWSKINGPLKRKTKKTDVAQVKTGSVMISAACFRHLPTFRRHNRIQARLRAPSSGKETAAAVFFFTFNI